MLLEKTEGNPLFVEETTRMLLEGGTSKRIPDTLQAIIAARIDRLPREREAAAAARLGDRQDLLGGRRRATSRPTSASSSRSSTVSCSATS